MIEVIDSFGGESFKCKVNHGYKVNHCYIGIDAYKDVENPNNWSNCPCCDLKPKVWEFNNGRSTLCGCGNGRYDNFSVHAESIMSVHARCGGNVKEYESDQLRKNWNEYCATMINPCSQGDLHLEGKW